jgi:hypothetical protein
MFATQLSCYLLRNAAVQLSYCQPRMFAVQSSYHLLHNAAVQLSYCQPRMFAVQLVFPNYKLD